MLGAPGSPRGAPRREGDGQPSEDPAAGRRRVRLRAVLEALPARGGGTQQLELQLGRKLPQLSMGMSGDYEVAVEEGATLVRVGTALFGARTQQGG